MYFEDAICKINEWYGNFSTIPTAEWKLDDIRNYSYVELVCNELINIISDHPFDDAIEWVDSYILNLKYNEQFVAGKKGADILEIESETAYAILYILKGDITEP